MKRLQSLMKLLVMVALVLVGTVEAFAYGNSKYNIYNTRVVSYPAGAGKVYLGEEGCAAPADDHYVNVFPYKTVIYDDDTHSVQPFCKQPEGSTLQFGGWALVANPGDVYGVKSFITKEMNPSYINLGCVASLDDEEEANEALKRDTVPSFLMACFVAVKADIQSEYSVMGGVKLDNFLNGIGQNVTVSVDSKYPDVHAGYWMVNGERVEATTGDSLVFEHVDTVKDVVLVPISENLKTINFPEEGGYATINIPGNCEGRIINYGIEAARVTPNTYLSSRSATYTANTVSSYLAGGTGDGVTYLVYGKGTQQVYIYEDSWQTETPTYLHTASEDLSKSTADTVYYTLNAEKEQFEPIEGETVTIPSGTGYVAIPRSEVKDAAKAITFTDEIHLAKGAVAIATSLTEKTGFTGFANLTGAAGTTINSTDGSVVTVAHNSVGNPGGKFWAANLSASEWTNTQALDEINEKLGTELTAADMTAGSALNFTAPGPGDSFTTLSIAPCDAHSGDAIVLYATVGGQNCPIDNITVKGVANASISYATADGEGFASDPAFASTVKNVSIVKVMGLLDNDRTVTLSSSTEFNNGNNTAKVGFSLAGYTLTLSTFSSTAATVGDELASAVKAKQAEPADEPGSLTKEVMDKAIATAQSYTDGSHADKTAALLRLAFATNGHEGYIEPVGVHAFGTKTDERAFQTQVIVSNGEGYGNGWQSDTLSDGNRIAITQTPVGVGKFWGAQAVKGAWTNTAALDALNRFTDVEFTEADLSEGTTLGVAANSNGQVNTNLELQLDAQEAGDQVTLITTAFGWNCPLDQITVSGLKNPTIQYATADGDGFTTEPTFTQTLQGLNMLKISGKLTADKNVVITSPTVCDAGKTKVGFQLATYYVKAASENARLAALIEGDYTAHQAGWTYGWSGWETVNENYLSVAEVDGETVTFSNIASKGSESTFRGTVDAATRTITFQPQTYDFYYTYADSTDVTKPFYATISEDGQTITFGGAASWYSG